MISVRRLLIAGLAFFALFVVSAAGATRSDRITHGALPMAAALACFGGTAWLAGRDLAARDMVQWRGIKFVKPKVAPFGYAWMAFGACCWLLAAAVVALLVSELRTAH